MFNPEFYCSKYEKRYRTKNKFEDHLRFIHRLTYPNIE